jgi:hypothetical protein
VDEWAISDIETHHGKGADALFKVIWKAGDCAWLPYHEISHLEAMSQYLEAQGAKSITQLPKKIVDEARLPVAVIGPSRDHVLRDVVRDTINWADHAAKGLIPRHGKKSDINRRRRAQRESYPSSEPTMPIAEVEVPKSELDRFHTFSQYIKDGHSRCCTSGIC